MSSHESILSSKKRQIFKTYLYDSLGWDNDIDVQSFESRITRVSRELGFTDIEAFIKSLENKKTDTKVIQAVAREFSVNESYFFRDYRFFEQFKRYIIPRIIEKQEYQLNIWSVGCCRGEEAYSIAMMLRSEIPDIEKWDIYILGTDVNPDNLDMAKKGIFNKWSFRQIPEFYMKQYFIPLGEKYKIHTSVKNMVDFKYHNIIRETLSCTALNGKGYDLILFKNVLIYLEKGKAKNTVSALFTMLKEGGYLATTPTEYSSELFDFVHSHCASDEWIIQKPYESKHGQSLADPKKNLYQYFSESETDNNVLEMADAFIDTTLLKIEKKYTSKQMPSKEEKEKDDHLYYYYNALKMLKSGETEKAKTSLLKSIYLDKDFVVAYIALGNILKKEEKQESAMKYINKAKAILEEMPPHDEVALTGGIMAINLLGMLNTIKGGVIG